MPDENIWNPLSRYIRMVGCSVMRSIDYLHDNSPMVAVVRRCFFDFSTDVTRTTSDRLMGARLLNYKDNRAANSMSAEKLADHPTRITAHPGYR